MSGTFTLFVKLKTSLKMKKLFILIFSILTVPALSQDIIHTHKGDSLNVKVVSVGENSITYSFPNETATNTIGNAAVLRVIFASGREQYISKKIFIGGEGSWENVTISNNPADIIGLRRVGEVNGKAGGYWGMRTVKGADKKATERIKRDAAKMGAHIVFILEKETTGRKGYYSNPESIQSGAAYAY
jgi:hypothetical protein